MSIRDYKITDAQIAEKGVIASPDTLTGTADENKRVFDRLVRECVAPQFNEIVETFADMEESTNNWSAEEAQRVQQENARQSAEQGRVSAEGQRVQSEKMRLSAESRRVADENARSAAETARVNAENKRDSAEKSRVSAENARNVWQTYDAAKTYVPGNKVSFGGSSYLCTAATVGHEPTDTAYWLLIAQKGADGAGADDLRRINDALDAIDPTKIIAKAEPADGDGVMIADSADGGKAKRLLWSSVKTALGKLFVPQARKINGKVLTEDVTLTGENIAVSGTDPTPISGAVKYRTNPNLLDNWFFGRPVNQRNGYIIPAGVEYNDLSWNHAGTTDKAYPVVGYSGQDPLITIDGTNYIVGVASQVPGYCDGYSYSIDRWKSEVNIVVTFESDGISLENVGVEAGQFKQELPPDFSPEGTLLCISAIVKSASGDARLLLSQSNNPWGHTIDFIPLQTGFFSGSGNLMGGNHKFSIYLGAGAKIKLAAVKLELGSTQTLAHKEGDKWVLNEIPDFGEQLRRCTYYAEKVESRDTPAITNSTFVPPGATSAVFILPYVRKRTVPAINFNDVSNYRVIARSISGETTAFSVTSISLLDVGRTKAAILVSFNATDKGYYCFLQRSDIGSDGYAFISADL